MIIKNYELETRIISNIDIYNVEMDIPEPKAPFFELDDGRVIENYHDPVYNHCVMLYSQLKSSVIFERILETTISSYDMSYLDRNEWKRKWKLIKENHRLNHNEKTAFLLYEIFTDDTDKEKLVDSVILTENRVQKFFNSVSVVRQGVDVREAHVKNAINTGVESIPVIVGRLQIVSPLDEYKVASESGISWNHWLKDDMTLDDKASAIALYRLDKLVHLHQEDAAQIESERKQKKSGA